MSDYLAPILHAVVTLALLAAYTTLAALGEPNDVLLGSLIGYLGGLGVRRGVQAAVRGGP